MREKDQCVVFYGVQLVKFEVVVSGYSFKALLQLNMSKPLIYEDEAIRSSGHSRIIFT